MNIDQQRARLLLEIRERGGYTYGFFLRRTAWRYVVLLFGCATIVLGCWLAVPPWAPEAISFLVGFMGAVLLRDSAWVRAVKAAWPFNEKVLDWDKIEQLAYPANAPPESD